MKVYTLFSKSLKYHNLPFYEESDVAAINRIRNCVVANVDQSLNINIPDLVLYCHGDFDGEKGFNCKRVRYVISVEDIKCIDSLQEEWREKNDLSKCDESTEE